MMTMSDRSDRSDKFDRPDRFEASRKAAAPASADNHKSEGKERSRVLLVDDEAQIVRTLQATLSTQGYEIRTAANGLDGLILFREWKPDLVITDLSMPEMSGVELCREIRTIATTPIIVLSVREQEGAKVSALDAGADDYVTKPFNIQELKARVRAQLRRQDAIKVPLQESVLVGDFSINVEQHRVKVRGTDVHLTPKQFELLLYMAHHPGKVLSHRDLLNAVWGANATTQPEYLRVAIGHLRKKLGEHGEQYLQTEPWVGYRFVPTPEEEAADPTA
jgi:two-component system KDP operon response regulator KdpE